jgi:hypothetical protein
MAAHRFTGETVGRLKLMAARGFPAAAIAVELGKMTSLQLTAESIRKKAVAVGVRLKCRDSQFRAGDSSAAGSCGGYENQSKPVQTELPKRGAS